MTGTQIVLAAIVLALSFGGYRRLTDGRATASVAGHRLDAAALGSALGDAATLVQFSSSTCAPCAATRRVLQAVVDEQHGVTHCDIDAETRLDLVERFGISRTPTVLLLDRSGEVRHRIVGAARRTEVVEALTRVAA